MSKKIIKKEPDDNAELSRGMNSEQIKEFFANNWKNKPLCTLSEAVCLYCLYDPDSGTYLPTGDKKEYMRYSPCGQFYIRHKKTTYKNGSRMLTGCAEEEVNKETWGAINLQDLLKRDLLAQIIAGEADGDEYWFKPTEILKWIAEKSKVQPPEELSLALGLINETSFKKGKKKDVTKENEHIVRAKYEKYRGELKGQKSNARQDRDAMRKRCPEYNITDELIKEFREKKLPESERRAGRPARSQ